MAPALFNLPEEKKTQTRTAENLTPKQERFANLLVEGKTAAEAYREAYKPKKTTKDKTIWEAASRLKNNSKVRARVEFLRSKAASESIISSQEVLENISKIAKQESGDSKMQSVILKANELMGKHYGLFEDNLNLKQTMPTVINVVGGAK